MLSRGISWIIPLVTCILLDVYTLAIAFTEKIQVTRGMFYGIPFESVIWCVTGIQHSRF